MRTRGVVWVPDWPVVTAMMHENVDPSAPVAVLSSNRVIAANGAALAGGITVGMRKRTAQATLPDLAIFKQDVSAEVAAFERVVRSCEAHIAHMSILEPGTLTFSARGPVRAAGSEEKLTEALLGEIAADSGMEAHVGFAQGLLGAVLAARRDMQITNLRAFLDGQPMSAILEACFSPQVKKRQSAFISSLSSLGVRYIGDLRGLDREAVVTRFGVAAVEALALISGEEELASGRLYEATSCVIDRDLDDPLERIDQAAFLAREMAEMLVDDLTRRGVISREITIETRAVSGRSRRRSWNIDTASSRDITDRVRWQLSAWMAEAEDGPDSGIIHLGISASELYPAGYAQGTLWGGDRTHEKAAQRAVSRIQTLLGQDSVVVPEKVGGRQPQEAYLLTSWEAEKGKHADVDAPWPGAIPQPWPSTLKEKPVKAAVLDRFGHECLLSSLGTFYCSYGCADPRPARLVEAEVSYDLVEYAGPWLQSVGWWNPQTQQRKAWCEAVDEQGRGLLFHREHQQWWLSGVYA